MAYVINYRSDYEEEIIRAKLFGGDKKAVAPVEWEGRVVEEADVEFCIMRGLRIRAPLLAAVPNAAKVEINPDGSLPDVGPVMINGWIVSQDFVDIAERFEPGKHQYFPLDATDLLTGQPTPKKLYLLNVIERVSATVPELSVILIKTTQSGRKVIQPRLPYRKITLSKAKIQNHHLWGGGTWDLSLVKFLFGRIR